MACSLTNMPALFWLWSLVLLYGMGAKGVRADGLFPERTCKPEYGVFKSDMSGQLVCTEEHRIIKVVVGDPGPDSKCLVCQGVDCPSCVTIVGPCQAGCSDHPITSTVIPPPGTDVPTTVLILTPPTIVQSQPPAEVTWTTFTTPWTGTGTITESVPPDGTIPGTVIIRTPEPPLPPSFTTLTTPWTGTGTTTDTVPPEGTNPGTVIIRTPEPPLPPSFTTLTTPWTGTGTTTETVPPDGTVPGTVIIRTPEASTTSDTLTSDSSSTPTPTNTPQSSFPPSFTTVTTPWTGTSTTTETVPPDGTTPGTVIIRTPVPSTSSGTPTSTSTPTPTPTPPKFSCDAGGYLIQGTTLYRLNLETGDNPAVSRSVGPGGNINAIGYNVLDNYIYGFVNIGGGQWQLLQIDAQGGSRLLPLKVDKNYDTGDIDENGQLWVAEAESKSWAQVDLRPGSATYGRVVASGPMTPPGGRVADWTYLENGGRNLYSITWTDTARLVRWSMDTKQWTEVTDYGVVTPNNEPKFGALYAVGNEMWGSDNTSGNIIAFPVLEPGEEVRDIATGPQSTNNDGARCFRAPPP